MDHKIILLKRRIFLLGILLFVVFPGTRAQRLITPEDLVSGRAVSKPRLSPDGRWVVFEVRRSPKDNSPGNSILESLRIVPADGKGPSQKFVDNGYRAFSPAWSPDGTSVAFLSDRGEKGKIQIWLKIPFTDHLEQVSAFPQNIKSFQWVTRDLIAFIASDTGVVVTGAENKAVEGVIVMGEKERNNRLWELDMRTRQITAVTDNEKNVAAFDYSPDGKKIVLRVSPAPDEDAVSHHSSLVVVDRKGRVIKRLGGEDKGFSLDYCWGSPKWSPGGKRIASFVTVGPTYLPVVFSYDSGKGKILAEDYHGTVWYMNWNPATGDLYCSGNRGVQGFFGKIDIKNNRVILLKKVNRSYSEAPDWSFCREGRWVAYQDASYDHPDEVWIMNTDGREARRLTDMNPQFAGLDFCRQEVIRWKSFDGQEIEGVLIFPRGYDSTRTWPLIVDVHGGPTWAWWNGYLANWHEWGQLLASHGFMVLYPNPRGSNGYGWQFAEKNISDWGGGDFRDIMAGVDYLVEAGIADSARLGIGGWSYGGFMTAWAITQTGRFKAAVMGAAVTDLTTMYSTCGRPENFSMFFEGSPYTTRGEVYRNHSPVTFVREVKTPVLILHGQADPVVPVTQSYEYYQGVKDQGATCRFVVYPRETHAIHEYVHKKDLLTRVLDWYTRYLR